MDTTPDTRPTPLCPGCLAPIDATRYYCEKCGRDTGQFTTYVPYVDIPWMATGFGAAWHRLWHGQLRWYSRVGYVLFLLAFAPVLFVGLPFVLLARRRGGANQQP